MASPNTSFSEIITTTIRNRSGALADNVSNGNAILRRLTAKGNRKAATGRTIIQELEYAEGTFQWYSGYEVINITPPDVITAAEYNWKQAASPVSVSGLESDVQNTGKEAKINLVEARVKNAEKTLRNNITAGLYSDGTGSSGKQLTGLAAAVPVDPTTGTYGGINRSATNSTFWRSQQTDGTAITSTSITASMNTTWLNCVRGTDTPDLIMADSLLYGFYLASLQSIQRIMSSEMAEAGFTSLKYMDADVVFEDASITANRMYFLNTDYLFLRFSPKRNFTPLENVQSVNQDACTQLIVWAGELTVSNSSVQGLLHT